MIQELKKRIFTTITSRWGEDGYIRLAKGNKCGTDSTPLDGTGCVNGPGSDVRTTGFLWLVLQYDMFQVQHVCGQCGVLFDTSYPLGAKLVQITAKPESVYPYIMMAPCEPLQPCQVGLGFEF